MLYRTTRPLSRSSLSKDKTRKEVDENVNPYPVVGQNLREANVLVDDVLHREGDVLKAYLYFPLDGVPRVVWLRRNALRTLDFAPYLRAEPPLELRRTYMVTEPSSNYVLVYFKQTRAALGQRNDFLSCMLGRLAPNLRRPWFGPVLVSFDSSDVLTPGTLRSEAVDVVHHLHAVYDRIARDGDMPCDSLEPNPSVRFISAREFVQVFRGDIRAAVDSLS
ncbi:hypothetical protein VNI00_005498 [Paramarasmius palmivorus]|uniref:Uncharacterized protein n=1 Tax=Paramarasmius palmivorus TaxID=297713 RepID=A0AAW0DEH5_9AGAR